MVRRTCRLTSVMAAYLASGCVLFAYIMHTYEVQQGMLAYSTGQRLGSIITKKVKGDERIVLIMKALLEISTQVIRSDNVISQCSTLFPPREMCRVMHGVITESPHLRFKRFRTRP